MRTSLITCIALLFVLAPDFSFADTKEDRKWRRIAHPIIREYCTECHNAVDKKAGLDLIEFYYVPSVISRGETWRHIVDLVKNNEMPPHGSKPMSQADKDSFIYIINHVLDNALQDPDPGPSMIRRLSHREYSYTIKDLTGVDFNAMSYFPKEGSGGEGFDNQSGVLFTTPLTMERYYMAADSIVRELRNDPERWDDLVSVDYSPGIFRHFANWVTSWFSDDPPRWSKPVRRAEEAILPFATKAFRGFLDGEDRSDLMSFFEKLYFDGLWKEDDGFDDAIATVYKRILVSPIFLYRSEINQPIHKPYKISNVELATRLSYLLWSSMPDDTLFDVAYREDLHNPEVLNREVLRMMRNPKFSRFSQSFATQWLGVEESLNTPKADKELFPEFTDDVRQAMREEVVRYFHHVFSEEKDLLELIDSDYTLLNEDLARHYEVPDVSGDAFRKVNVAGQGRGGVLGMGAVLAATSLPNRTSPVLRGQWVLEQILGTPPPPPPPDVPELSEEGEGGHDELDLRTLLEKHRSSPNCAGCHKKMDPIGFAMENFDAVGKWRNYYRGEATINTSAIMENGQMIDGPLELRQALSEEKELFARNFVRKMLSYALGRGVGFTDSPTVKELTDTLLQNDFDSEEMMLALVNSYPFRYRRSDMTELYIKEYRR